jgi:hypothetical protein
MELPANAEPMFRRKAQSYICGSAYQMDAELSIGLVTLSFTPLLIISLAFLHPTLSINRYEQNSWPLVCHRSMLTPDSILGFGSKCAQQ